MKGRTSNTMRTNANCYASGGAVTGVPPSASPAPAARRDGGACAPDGKAAKPSLARVGRKVMKKREDGGRISDDSRREAARLRGEASEKSVRSGIQGGIGAILATLPRTGGRAGHLFGKGVGALNLGAAVDNHFGGRRDHAEADRIERGEAEPGREDRKDGGKVGKKNWIGSAIKKPGALHRSLGVPMGENIPAKKLDKAAHSDNPTLAKRANLAKTLKGFK